MNNEVILKTLGLSDYQLTWQQMQAFTQHRDAITTDEFWLCEHASVFTQGKAGKAEHILAAGDIPVVQIDRGGQVTYHGPGQILLYTLFDLTRSNMGVKQFVNTLEQAVINLLSQYGIKAKRREKAPGVYVEDRKIAALGLKVSKGRCFHGLALNVDIDLSPYQRINPCGYAGMEVTRMSDFIDSPNIDEIGLSLAQQLASLLNSRLLHQKAA